MTTTVHKVLGDMQNDGFDEFMMMLGRYRGDDGELSVNLIEVMLKIDWFRAKKDSLHGWHQIRGDHFCRSHLFKVGQRFNTAKGVTDVEAAKSILGLAIEFQGDGLAEAIATRNKSKLHLYSSQKNIKALIDAYGTGRQFNEPAPRH